MVDMSVCVVMPEKALGIPRGRKPRKALEIMDEVGLIVVTAIECNLCPFRVSRRMDGSEHALKAAHPAERLGRKSSLIVKELRKPPVAQPNRIDY